MVIDCGGYQLRPYCGNTCWELWKHSEVRHKDGTTSMMWTSTGYYPSTLEHGLRMILEQQARSVNEELGIKWAIAELRRMTDDIMRSVSP